MGDSFSANNSKRGPIKLQSKIELRFDEKKRCSFVYLIFHFNFHRYSIVNHYSKKSLVEFSMALKIIQVYFILLCDEKVTHYNEVYNGPHVNNFIGNLDWFWKKKIFQMTKPIV